MCHCCKNIAFEIKKYIIRLFKKNKFECQAKFDMLQQMFNADKQYKLR